MTRNEYLEIRNTWKANYTELASTIRKTKLKLKCTQRELSQLSKGVQSLDKDYFTISCRLAGEDQKTFRQLWVTSQQLISQIDSMKRQATEAIKELQTIKEDGALSWEQEHQINQGA